jgi:hypothetical protein
MQTAYGHSVETDNDFYVQLAETAMTATVETGKGHLFLSLSGVKDVITSEQGHRVQP